MKRSRNAFVSCRLCVCCVIARVRCHVLQWKHPGLQLAGSRVDPRCRSRQNRIKRSGSSGKGAGGAAAPHRAWAVAGRTATGGRAHFFVYCLYCVYWGGGGCPRNCVSCNWQDAKYCLFLAKMHRWDGIDGTNGGVGGRIKLHQHKHRWKHSSGFNRLTTVCCGLLVLGHLMRNGRWPKQAQNCLDPREHGYASRGCLWGGMKKRIFSYQMPPCHRQLGHSPLQISLVWLNRSSIVFHMHRSPSARGARLFSPMHVGCGMAGSGHVGILAQSIATCHWVCVCGAPGTGGNGW